MPAVNRVAPFAQNLILPSQRVSLVTFLLLFLMTHPTPVWGAPLTGTPLNEAYYAMYNLNFPRPPPRIQQWMTAHPEDPLGPASNAAAYIFTEFDRLGVIDIELFADDNRFTSRKRPAVDPALQRNRKDANAYYVKAWTSGMRADWASLIDRHEYGAYKFSELASKYAKQALAINPTLYDANLAVGIENYMLSLKAAPIRWILGMTGAGTNKAEGVRLLKLTAEQ